MPAFAVIDAQEKAGEWDETGSFLTGRTCPQPEIEAEWLETDTEIDRLAYQLYGLSDEEIAGVEGAC